MKLSTKGRYAIIALTDLAIARQDEMTSLAEISKRQDISLPYLEQLFVRLRRAGLVTSVRGPGGGYRLARAAETIRIAEVLEAVDEPVPGAPDRVGGGLPGVLEHLHPEDGVDLQRPQDQQVGDHEGGG